MHHLKRLCAPTTFSPRHSTRARREIIIVDEFTGRLMPGRRWSEGLHQAVEAKEGVEIRRKPDPRDDHFQNYFRMYKKLAA